MAREHDPRDPPPIGQESVRHGSRRGSVGTHRGGSMEFKILGPLEGRQDDRALAPTAAKQRLLLAILLLHPNEVVSSDRLIETLWGGRPPAGAPKALQMHVSH